MLLTYAPMHIARGLSSGSGKFSNYALIIGLDGTIRVGVCAALWLAGVESTGVYAVAVGLAPIVGVVFVAARGDLRLSDGPPASWSEITPNLGWLLLGSLFAAALVNAGPITVDILGSDEPAEVVTRFGNAVIFARVPLFLFQAVQAALLPKLARLAAQGDMDEFTSGLRRLIALVVAVGILGTVGAFAIGPWVLELVYEGGIDRRTMGLLAGASAIYMLALALAQAVIALHGHAAVAYGWIAGFATFGLVAWLSSDDLYLRVELALIASSLVSLVVFAVVARCQLRAGSSVDVESMIEAITERPLD
jgi:O-antigen/teichoic acid export membrane protein